MATFTINAGYGSAEDVQADRYNMASGYFHFYDEDDAQVFTISESKVISITRV